MFTYLERGILERKNFSGRQLWQKGLFILWKPWFQGLLRLEKQERISLKTE